MKHTFWTLLLTAFLALQASVVYGMDIDIHERSGSGDRRYVSLKGEIMPGDAAKLLNFYTKDVRGYQRTHQSDKDWEDYSQSRVESQFILFGDVHISSPGGNVNEAIKIGKILRSAMARVFVGDGETCVSSCFLIYASVPERQVLPGGRLGIHRPYFNKEHYVAVLPEKLQSAHAELEKMMSDFLKGASVPGYLIDLMFSRSSLDIYMLTANDLNAVGKYANWWEETMIANCKLTKKEWARLNASSLKTNDADEFLNYRNATLTVTFRSC